MNIQTGSFDSGVAEAGAQTLTKRQSSDWEEDGSTTLVPKQMGWNYSFVKFESTSKG